MTNLDVSASPVGADLPDLQGLAQGWLEAIGDDPSREGLQKTPQRVAAAWQFLTMGYRQTPKEVANDAIFDAPESGQMIIVKNIEFYSICEHHLLPFFGHAHVAYIPDRKILGLSKIARIVDVFARRLQVQERITVQISSAIEDLIHPAGIGVTLEAQHLCMSMRGVAKQNASTVTTSVNGVMRSNTALRSEFEQHIRSS